MFLVLESDKGMVLETLHRNTNNDGLVRKAVKGKTSKNKYMVFFNKKKDDGWPGKKYP